METFKMYMYKQFEKQGFSFGLVVLATIYFYFEVDKLKAGLVICNNENKEIYKDFSKKMENTIINNTAVLERNTTVLERIENKISK